MNKNPLLASDKALQAESEVNAMPTSRLTHYELELMDVLWELGEGTVQDVCNALDRELAYTTVMTTLSLLESKKGVLRRVKRGRAFVYRPKISREEVSRSILGDLKNVLFRDRLPSMILSLIDQQELSDEDLQTLQQALDTAERRRRKKR